MVTFVRVFVTAILLACGLVLTGGSPAHAQEPAPTPPTEDETLDQEARALFDAAVTAYQNARYESALDHFRQAYEMSHRPELLYNIAQAADRARHDREALEAFEAFLAAVPDTDRRPSVERRIASLRAMLANDGTALIGPVVIMVVGGLASITGIALYAVGDGMRSEVENAEVGTPFETVEDAYRTAPDLLLSGQVVGWLGLAVIAGGATWLIVELTSGGGGESASVSLSPGRVSLEGRF